MSANNSDDSAQAHGPTLSRRGLLKTVGAAGTAAVAPAALDGGPVGEAEALPCGGVCVGAAVVGGAAAVGWALREYEVVGADDPAEGLTADSLKNQIHNTVQTRKSTNASTFVDNRNIISSGYQNTLYGKGKMAALSALNNQESESAVLAAAKDAAEAHATTIEKNLLKSWNESVSELFNLYSAASNHSELTANNIINNQRNTSGGSYPDVPDSGQIIDPMDTASVDMPDGSTFTVNQIETGGSNVSHYDPTQITVSEFDDIAVRVTAGQGEIDYLIFSEWNSLYSTLTAKLSEVKTGLDTWVTNVYSEVQAGTLEPGELLTSDELANITTDKEGYNQAIADLMALNIPINLEREAEITIDSTDTTLYGSLGVTAETTLNAGDSINPSNDSKDYYLTYDVSEANGNWSAYEEAVDGGTVTFTEEPHPSTLYGIETGAQETAELASSDFSDQGDGTWTADITDQVETAITTITAVQFYSEREKTKNVTVLLDEPFTIESFTDSDGEEVDSAEYSKTSKAQTDDNYLTEEEWKQREEKYKEQIDKYEESQNSSGPGVSIGDFSPQQMISGALVLGLTALGINTLSS
ncbi:twin-arginine translocation signal domain-containing protein [Haloarcula sediminis]|uniref:twin-arginine translocation signal domain-containing protein n=1 Tax=Haloarcula sediminis TaxID=3111777 RepID=UPI002D78293D|nr:twin-arginine translocation signal domain-containing protein [Haloarcula sp. CK38]